MKEYCNPLNIEYKFQHYGKTAHREAADPTMVYFKGTYYIFASMSAGFYYSSDLANWKWHENRDLDMYRYAPDVHQVGDYLYFCASSRKIPSTFWRTKDPLSDHFEKVAEPFDFWDPAFFKDDDGRFYLYWGIGQNPLLGVELDPVTMKPIGEKVALIKENIAEHGWERMNAPGVVPAKAKSFLMNVVEPLINPKRLPYLEGSFMTKEGGKYYLQYAAPGTQLNVYGDGVYTSDNPLGPFVFQKHNPFSYKPTGFMPGAGHGSTVKDEFGNYWHVATMTLSVNQAFERRIGLFPAGFDEDGILFCNQNFADYPIIIPEGRFDPRQLHPHYMMLSYKKKGTASSTLTGHEAALALNEDIQTWWCAKGSAGEWYQLDLGKVYDCHSIQLNLAEEGIAFKKHPKKDRSIDISSSYRYVDSDHTLRTRTVLEGSLDGVNWIVLKDLSKADSDLSHDYVILPELTKLRYIKVTAVELAYDQRFAISGLRVFGLDSGERPSQVKLSKIKQLDPMTATLTWEKISNATGYNIRYGIAPDKLYTSYLVYGKQEIVLAALNKGVDYWCCIDSFNESGITEGTVQVLRN